jgi:hypothetical protein
VTFEGEIAWGPLPFSVVLSPSWIWDYPSEDIDAGGFQMGLAIRWYVTGDAIRGFWFGPYAEFETFRATLLRETTDGSLLGTPDPELCDPDSEPGTCSARVQSFIVGAMLGSGTVFGKKGGFALNGGIGIGVALADTKELRVNPDPRENPTSAQALGTTFYDETGRIQLLGSLGLGIAF